jgi:hypothetical protein
VIEKLLRSVAIAIAVAAAIDPPLTVAARARPRVSVVLQSPEADDARRVYADVVRLARPEFDVVIGQDASADAAVVVGTGYPETPTPPRQRTFTVAPARGDREPNTQISAVRVPREVPPGTLIHLEADVDAANVSASSTSTLIVRAGEAHVEVARATHTWRSSTERWRAPFDVTPLDPEPWRLHIEVSAAAGERLVADNSADAVVMPSGPLRVLVYEPRPSWTGTFVRRAIERDARFDVAGLANPSRGIAVTEGEFPPLRASALVDARVVIVGGLDRLAPQDAGALTSFMRDRGGVVLLLPDSRSDAQAASSLLPVAAGAEILLEKPARLSVEAPLAPLDASELLTFARGAVTRVLAATGSQVPVVTAAPVGVGQIVVSGALDAWRFRANSDAGFDRFWPALVAGLAASVPPAVDVAVVPAIVAPGGNARIQVRVNRAAAGLAANSELRVAATVGGDTVRLWPDATPDTFHGSLVAPAAPGNGRVVVTATNGATGTARYVVAPHARAATTADPPLSLLAESHGGSHFSASDVNGLMGKLRQDVPTATIRAERRPMRSLWWFAPFAVCLGGEWWLRRRRGLR